MYLVRSSLKHMLGGTSFDKSVLDRREIGISRIYEKETAFTDCATGPHMTLQFSAQKELAACGRLTTMMLP